MYPNRSRVGLPYVKVTLVIFGNGKERERYNPNYFSPKILEKLTIDRQKKKRSNEERDWPIGSVLTRDSYGRLVERR